MALIDADENGRIVFNTWGEQFSGRIRESTSPKRTKKLVDFRRGFQEVVNERIRGGIR